MSISNRRLRQEIASVAARFLFEGKDEEYTVAKRRAARHLGVRFTVRDLPSNREVREQLDHIKKTLDSHGVHLDPWRLKISTLRWMRKLARFSPRTPIAMMGDASLHQVDLHLAAGPHSEIRSVLDRACLEYQELESSAPTGTEFHFVDDCPVRVRILAGTVLPPDSLTSSECEEVLLREVTADELAAELLGLNPRIDRFAVYCELLSALEEVRLDPLEHAEGDALHHSLQVFDLAVEQRGFDEDLLTAALLHDVGAAVNVDDPVPESLDLLDGIVTHRCRRLIRLLDAAHGYRELTLDPVDRRRLRACADFDDLLLLAELDESGRRPGAATSTIPEALDRLRSLDAGW